MQSACIPSGPSLTRSGMIAGRRHIGGVLCLTERSHERPRGARVEARRISRRARAHRRPQRARRGPTYVAPARLIPRGGISGFALRSPVKSHSAARAAGALPRLPWPPFDLSASNLRRLGRTLSPGDTATLPPARAAARGPDVVRSGRSEFRRRDTVSRVKGGAIVLRMLGRI